MCTRLPFLSVALLLPAALSMAPTLTAQKVNDTVIKNDGARIRGVEITEFLLTGVRGKRGDDPYEIPAHQVLDVEWSDPPEEYLAGHAAMQRGDFQTATQMFGAVRTDRALLKADAEFFKVKAAVAAIGNDKAAAAEAASHAKSWISSNVNHWRTPEALLLAGRAERLAGTGGTAATTLKELDDRAVREGFGTIWSARAKYELALTYVADGKASEARTMFKSAAASAKAALDSADGGDRPELQSMITQARVGEGETYLSEKEYDKAANYFRELANGSDPALVAAGHAGEGEAIFLSAPQDLDKVRRAQMALAKACVFDAANGEASAKANYYLGRCLLALGPDREGDEFKQRANEYFRTVFTSYSSTRWAALARLEASK